MNNVAILNVLYNYIDMNKQGEWSVIYIYIFA